MKKQKVVENRVLIIAACNDFRAGIRAMLEKAGYDVLSRQSIERTVQLLEMSEISILVTDFELEDGNYFDLLKTIRSNDAYYSDIPIYCVGNDSKPEECVQTLEAGADEYSHKPLNRKIFLARTGKLISNLVKSKNNPVTLELRVDAGELPGFFQFLEAEIKTGVLKAAYQKDKGEITFKDGKIVKAETEYCAAQDALTEVLTWPFCHLKFIEEDVEGKFDLNLTVSGTLMDCVFEVDEYKEVLQRYPDLEISFVQGEKQLPKNSNRVAKKVHRMATSGTILDEILEAMKLNRRHLILLIDQLVQMGHLKRAEHPFSNYLDEQQNHYKASGYLKKSLPGVIDAVETLNYTNFQELETLAITVGNENSIDTPKIFITGDHTELNELLFKTFHKIAGNSVGKKSGVKSSRAHEAFTRLSFANSSSLDMHKLPPKIDEIFLRDMKEEFEEGIAIFHIVSGLDRETSRKNRKLLKQLRDHFKGAYYLIIPNLDEENPEMNIDCKHCFHKLAVDIDHEGSMGNCPICNSEITIPECLDYSAECLKLAPEVPRVFISPGSPEECRDLLTLCCHTLLYSIPSN